MRTPSSPSLNPHQTLTPLIFTSSLPPSPRLNSTVHYFSVLLVIPHLLPMPTAYLPTISIIHPPLLLCHLPRFLCAHLLPHPFAHAFVRVHLNHQVYNQLLFPKFYPLPTLVPTPETNMKPINALSALARPLVHRFAPVPIQRHPQLVVILQNSFIPKTQTVTRVTLTVGRLRPRLQI